MASRFGARRWGKSMKFDVFANAPLGTASGATANTAAGSVVVRNVGADVVAGTWLTDKSAAQVIDTIAGYGYIVGGTQWSGTAQRTGDAYRAAAHMSILGAGYGF